jgi:hypothetical protein
MELPLNFIQHNTPRAETESYCVTGTRGNLMAYAKHSNALNLTSAMHRDAVLRRCAANAAVSSDMPSSSELYEALPQMDPFTAPIDRPILVLRASVRDLAGLMGPV